MIEFMSAPEQPFKPLPVDDDVIVKLPSNTHIMVGGQDLFRARSSSLHVSTKELKDKTANPIIDYFSPQEFFEEGIIAEILEPGKKWVKGMIRLHLALEFIPDEPENNGTSDKSVSTLDDIRNINL